MVSKQASGEELTKFKEIMLNNGIHNEILEVIIKDSGLRGENLASDTEHVTIKFSARKPLELFVKKKTNNPVHCIMLDESKFFEKEATFFTEYLPTAREYCKGLGLEELLSIYPKCYYGDHQTMIFENLVSNDYAMIRKELQQDAEAARFSLANLAKHHAISYALIQEAGGLDKFFEKYPCFKFEGFLQNSVRKMVEPSFENGINTCIQILEESEEMSNYLEQIKILKSIKGKALIPEAIGNDCKDFLLLNHGDYWNNNMMFLKDKESSKISHQVMVDFQMVRCGSPGFDLAFYFLTSVKGSVRRNNFRELLQFYLKVLTETTRQLRYPMHLNIDELIADFCQNFKLGFYFGINLIAGPGYSVLKDIDLDTLKDMSEWADKFNELVKQWIKENPEKCKENIIEIREMADEYQQLLTGNV